jgi:hypothetical protein
MTMDSELKTKLNENNQLLRSILRVLREIEKNTK